MGDTGQVKVRVRSAKDLLAVAEALEQEAASRYRGLAAQMRSQGDHELAAQFDSLARMEDAHARQIGERSVSLFGCAADPKDVKWETPMGYEDYEARGAQLSAYQALAYAVRNEERAFAFYTYVSAEAERSEIRALADDLARDELQHASLLRHYRRRAFHEKRPLALQIPESLDDLRALARLWDAEASAAHGGLAETLRAAGQHGDAAIFHRLAEEEAQTAGGDSAAAAPSLQTAMEGLRLLEEVFDRYAMIAERANDESVVAEAQRLASQIIARLASTAGTRGNALLDHGGGH